ncbi:MAG: hypothetical protein EVA87_05095 [Rhodospirillaceae bacterium]|nr:hypothetical protein [Marinovum sp.]RZO37404.1 MAG: hypothetical protein EVA87_05095 [Rhodospirillaceae bacterium]
MSWDNFVLEDRAELQFTVSSAEMDTFRILSGDTNPLHADDAYARALGFDSKVVFGALIVAKISALVGVDIPGRGGVWTGLRIDFRKPLYPDETVTLTGTIASKSDAARMLTLRLRADTLDRCIVTGSAEAVFRGDD